MEVIVMKVERKEAGSVVARVIRTSVGPLAGDGLDEALGLAIGLRVIRSCEAMLDAELLTGGGKNFLTVGGAAVGEQALYLDALSSTLKCNNGSTGSAGI